MTQYVQKSTANSQDQTVHAPLAGTRIPVLPGYELIDQIGSGGMSRVFRARHIELDRMVALKFLKRIDPESKLSQRLEVEAKAFAKLKHPNIAQIYEIGSTDDGPFLSLEYLPGGTLDDRIDGPMVPREAAKLIATLASAIQYSHEQGVIHRDLKPGNILFDENDNPKIVDFGLAKISNQSQQLTQTGAMLGTLAYMAPEQASSVVKNIGPSCDVYALGCVLYELLVGKPPFMSDEYAQTITMILSTDPVPPRRMQPGVPRDLQTICLRCLQKRHRHRYASAGELADDLNRFLNGEPIMARQIGFVERAYLLALRRPAAAFFVCLSSLLLCALLIGSLIYNARLHKANTDISRQRDQYQDLFESGRELATWALFFHAEELAESKTPIQTQKRLAAQLQMYLDQLQKHADGNRDLSDELASAYERLAQIQGHPNHPNIGQVEDAIKNYTSALNLRKQLVEKDPTDPVMIINLAKVHADLGAVLGVKGQSDKALKSLEEASQCLKSINDPNSKGTAQRALSSTWVRIGDVQESIGELEKAEGSFLKALELVESTNPSSADEVARNFIMLLHGRLTRLAISQSKLGDSTASKRVERYYESLLESMEEFDPTNQDNPVKVQMLGQVLRVTADYMHETGEPFKAYEINKQVLKLSRELLVKDPGNSTVSRDIAISLSRIGEYHRDKEEFEKAISMLKESQELTAGLIEQDDANIELKKDQWINCYELGTCNMFLANWDDAEKHINQCLSIARLIASQGDDIVNAADNMRLAQSNERLATLLTNRANVESIPKKKRELFQSAKTRFQSSERFFELAKKQQPQNREIDNTLSIVRRMIERIDDFLANN